MANETILITTGTGQVGGVALDVLAARGIPARAGARAPSKVRARGVPTVRFDFTDPATFGPALEGVGAALVLAPPGHLRADTLLGPFVAEAARRRVRIVTMTASGVEHSDAIPLRQVELAVERSGTAYVHLRPTWFSQNFNTFWLGPILSDNVIALPAGDARTAFIDARDIGEAAANVLADPAHDGRVYTLTGPEALTYTEAAAALADVSGRPIRYVAIDDATFVKGAVAAGLPEDYAQMMAQLFGAVRAGAAAPVHEALGQLLARPPRTLADYARDHASAFRR